MLRLCSPPPTSQSEDLTQATNPLKACSKLLAMRVVSVVGARPQFVKPTPINMALKDVGTVLAYSRLISEATVHTLEIGQGNLISATPTSVVLSPTPTARRREDSATRSLRHRVS